MLDANLGLIYGLNLLDTLLELINKYNFSVIVRYKQQNKNFKKHNKKQTITKQNF